MDAADSNATLLATPMKPVESGPRDAETPIGTPLRSVAFSWWSFFLLALLLGLALPLALDPFRLGLVAKYVSFAFAAVGIVLSWGYGGILSLGQGIFFGLGSYSLAMFLKLEAAAIAGSGSALSQFYGSSLPDFMVWNSVEALPAPAGLPPRRSAPQSAC